MRQYSEKDFFKGYYFKCSENDHAKDGTKNRTIALIPALHIDGKEKSASLQIITNDNVYEIPYSNIEFKKSGFGIRIGKNKFSEQGIILDAETEDCKIQGKLKFGAFRKLKYSIMGPFEHIPYLQCRHCVISMRHSVTGEVRINDRIYSFHDGIGYIEGDSGRSFPKEYLWTQCHVPNGSLMLAVADIPMIGLSFKGIIGVVLIGDKEYRIATYLGARILSAGENEIEIRQGRYRLSAKLVEESSQKLKAPLNGKMSRAIHESIACTASYQFLCRDRVWLKYTGSQASFEYELKGCSQRKP